MNSYPLPVPISRPDDMLDYEDRVWQYMSDVEPGVYTAAALFDCFRQRSNMDDKPVGTARRFGVSLSTLPFVTRRQTKLGAGYDVAPRPARG